jgi:hypothetical protein
VSRVRPVLLALLGLAMGVTLVAMTAVFIWPSGESPYGWIVVGWIEDFPAASITPLMPLDRNGQTYNSTGMEAPDPPITALSLWMVHLEDGRLLALVARSPRMGCDISWRPTFRFGGVEGWFHDGGCGGSNFARDGTRVFGPSPRDMDRVAVEVDAEGRVFLDVSRVIAGTRPEPTRDPMATPTPAATMPALQQPPEVTP